MNEQSGSYLDHLFWRDEILQAMYWLQGEGIGRTSSAQSLSSLLDCGSDRLEGELRRLAAEGYLQPAGGGEYTMTDAGLETGRATFTSEFAELARSAHGACGPGCVCQRHRAGTAACQRQRA